MVRTLQVAPVFPQVVVVPFKEFIKRFHSEKEFKKNLPYIITLKDGERAQVLGWSLTAGVSPADKWQKQIKDGNLLLLFQKRRGYDKYGKKWMRFRKYSGNLVFGPGVHWAVA